MDADEAVDALHEWFLWTEDAEGAEGADDAEGVVTDRRAGPRLCADGTASVYSKSAATCAWSGLPPASAGTPATTT